MSGSKKAYRINIDNPHYCIVTSDIKEGTSYGEVKPFGEAMQIQITPSVASGQLFGNGATVDSTALLTGYAVQFDITKIPIEVRAEIYKQTFKDGVLQEKAGQTAEYIAVGYTVPQSDGTSEYIWLLKGRPEPLASDVKQSENNINYSTDKMNINFVKRESDNQLRFIADSAHPDFTEGQAKEWFTNGPSTYPKPSQSDS